MNQYFSWNGEDISRYILGTAQLGFDYGIANRDGQPDQKKADSIVRSAWNAGARTFDTARAYGMSESVLGRSLKLNGYAGDSKIITKISPVHGCSDYSWVRNSISASLESLGVPSLWAVLLHSYDMIDDWESGLGDELLRLKAAKMIRYLGVSVYTSKEVERLIDHPDIDIIQAPCNMWSPELITDGILETALEMKKLILIRSIFLQGLLIMSPEQVKLRLPQAYEASLVWNEFLAESGMGAWDICMRFAGSLEVPVIMGAENENQALTNGRFLDINPLDVNDIQEISERIKPYLSESVVNPTKWR